MYTEDELLPISALSHIVFCERRAALIHLEGAWEENRFTAEGRKMHEKVHEGGPESRAGVRIARGLRLRSLVLGLAGQADVVEFWERSSSFAKASEDRAISYQRSEEESEEKNRTDWTERTNSGEEKPGLGSRGWGLEEEGFNRREHKERREENSGWERVYPVEYKRGRPKPDRCDEVQLCAQALCLEEMLGVEIPEGAIFYGQPRRRHAVVFDEALREQTKSLAKRMHELFEAGITPSAKCEKKCEQCSLKEVCLPKAVSARRSVKRYVEEALKETGENLS